VTSTDWLSYPILDITDAPEAIDIVLKPPGTTARRRWRELDPPRPAALANAVFDATGVRLPRAGLRVAGHARANSIAKLVSRTNYVAGDPRLDRD
jgi:hypothetical protein